MVVAVVGTPARVLFVVAVVLVDGVVTVHVAKSLVASKKGATLLYSHIREIYVPFN